MTTYRYPFGVEVGSCARSITEPRPLFVLGAYPSALHVAWTPPNCRRGSGIRAIPVGDEPEPFWNGADEEQRIAVWKQAVDFSPAWGTVDPVGKFNGSSGIWVADNILSRLGVNRADAWISDCLDRYHASTGVTKALAQRFTPFANTAGLAEPQLPPHPSESAIVRAALAEHAARLTTEFAAARAGLYVTLGNAALRAFRRLVTAPTDAPTKLQASADGYGKPIPIEVDGHRALWYPLAHPAAPRPYQDAHKKWTPSSITA